MPEAVLRVEGLRVAFAATRRTAKRVPVDGVDFEIGSGEIVGLIGESGSGKSSIGRALVGLIPSAGGRVLLAGAVVSEPRALRLRVQYVPQGSLAALNPRLRVKRMIAEAVAVRRGRSEPHDDRVYELLHWVGLDPRVAPALPHQLSGGQRQRVALARALAVEPEVLICDEITSALDTSAQARILHLLHELRRDRGLSLLFISHDLPVVRSISDRILVLCEGIIVEEGSTNEVLASPRHAHTRQLVESVLGLDGH